MTRSEIIARARSAIGHQTIYRLGQGGFNPAASKPWNTRGECDCSGFVAWCLGMSRHLDHPWYASQNGGWFETTAIARDAESPYGFFDKVHWEIAQLGDLLVYGDSAHGQGHVGIISGLEGERPSLAIHCSAGNFRNHQDAIQETGVAVWMVRGIVARWAMVEDG